jgi:hypothetical protein
MSNILYTSGGGTNQRDHGDIPRSPSLTKLLQSCISVAAYDAHAERIWRSVIDGRPCRTAGFFHHAPIAVGSF